jgi:hypothetical protein
MNWTPVRKREARRLLAWALLLLLPMSVASCDGELNISYGHEYLLLLFAGSVYGVVFGGLGLGFLSLGLVSIWSQSAYARWSATSIALWQLLLGTMLFMIAGDWIYGADGLFQKQLFFPFFGHYGFFFEGTWFYVDADATLPDLFNSKTNEAAQMLDGITPLPLLGATWWLVQTYQDLRWMLRGRTQQSAS